MPIKVPGKRNRHGKMGGGKRTLVAVLSLTAMVDMFTVLVVFLLQNYKDTGDVLTLEKSVQMPSAASVKELKPSTVVIISQEMIRVNESEVITFSEVREQKDWFVESLFDYIKNSIEMKTLEFENSLSYKLQKTLNNNELDDQVAMLSAIKEVTIQADESIDLLSLKKIMYTITEAGATSINFAVIKIETNKPEEYIIKTSQPKNEG